MEKPVDRFSTQIRRCMEALARCHVNCLSTAMTQCLEMGGEHARPQHLRLMLDCAAVCAFASDTLARKSQFHNGVCALAADVCDVCARDCERLGSMEFCVSACRETSALCREVARLEHAEILAMASMLPPGR